MGRIAIILAGLSLSACSDSGALFLELDIPQEAGAYVVLMRESPPRALAFDAASSDPIVTTAPEVFLLIYPGDLQSLELPKGEIPLDQPSSCALLRPTSIRVARTAHGQDTVQWSNLPADAGLPDLFSRLVPNSAECDPCIEFDVVESTLEGALGDGAFALTLPDGAVLMGSDDGILVRFDPDRTVEALGRLGPAQFGAGTIDANGRIWLVGRDRDLWSGTLESGFTRTGSIGSEALIRRSSLAVSDDGREIALVYPELLNFAGGNEMGGLEVVIDGQWSLADTWPTPEDQVSSVVRWDGGFVAAGRFAPQTVTRYTVARGVSEESIPRQQFVSSISGLTVHPTLGLVAGDTGGRLFQRTADGVWTSLTASDEVGTQAKAICPFKDGIVTGGKGGVITQFVPGHRLCATQGGASANVVVLAPLGDGLVAAIKTELHTDPMKIAFYVPPGSP